MSGLTDYSIRSETARRAGATVRQQLVASLRAGGLPAEAADIESARGDIVNLLVTGRLRSLDDAVLRQRKLAPAGAGRSRIVVADIKVVHAGIALDAKTLVSFEAEDNAAAGRPAPQAAAVSAAPGVAPEPISADLDAHLRRIGAAAAERILVKAAGRDGRNRPVRRAPRASGLRAVS